jgi:hypothetical protein
MTAAAFVRIPLISAWCYLRLSRSTQVAQAGLQFGQVLAAEGAGGSVQTVLRGFRGWFGGGFGRGFARAGPDVDGGWGWVWFARGRAGVPARPGASCAVWARRERAQCDTTLSETGLCRTAHALAFIARHNPPRAGLCRVKHALRVAGTGSAPTGTRPTERAPSPAAACFATRRPPTRKPPMRRRRRARTQKPPMRRLPLPRPLSRRRAAPRAVARSSRCARGAGHRMSWWDAPRPGAWSHRHGPPR